MIILFPILLWNFRGFDFQTHLSNIVFLTEKFLSQYQSLDESLSVIMAKIDEQSNAKKPSTEFSDDIAPPTTPSASTDLLVASESKTDNTYSGQHFRFNSLHRYWSDADEPRVRAVRQRCGLTRWIYKVISYSVDGLAN